MSTIGKAISFDYHRIITDFVCDGTAFSTSLGALPEVNHIRQVTLELYQPGIYTGEQFRQQLMIPAADWCTSFVDGYPVPDNYVVGWDSIVSWRGTYHIPMFDVDSKVLNNVTNEYVIRQVRQAGLASFVLVKSSDRGRHVIGKSPVSWGEYEELLGKLNGLVDSQFVACTLARKYGTVRVSTSSKKPFAPVILERIG